MKNLSEEQNHKDNKNSKLNTNNEWVQIGYNDNNLDSKNTFSGANLQFTSSIGDF